MSAITSRPMGPKPYAMVLRAPSPSQRCDGCGAHVNVVVRLWGQQDLTKLFCLICAGKSMV